MTKAKYQQGRFKPVHPEKYQGNKDDIVYRSSWERKFMHWCDMNPSVIRWCSEELVIPYYSTADGKERRYFTDFIVQFKHNSGNTKTFIVEIKPASQMVEPKKGRKRLKTYMKECYDWQVNQDKWKAASEFAIKNGMEFRVLNEYDIGLKKR